jgi:hypothetical protein
MTIFLSIGFPTMNKNVLTLRNCTFTFECTAHWDELTKIPGQKDVRSCSKCQKEVYYCKSDSALVRHVRLNHCVAIHAEPHRTKHEIESENDKSILLGDICWVE